MSESRSLAGRLVLLFHICMSVKSVRYALVTLLCERFFHADSILILHRRKNMGGPTLAADHAAVSRKKHVNFCNLSVFGIKVF